MINIEKMIAFEEGKKLKAYKCTRGFLTVGIGHNLDTDPVDHILHRKINLGDSITESECNLLFKYDMDNVYQNIKRYMPWFDSLKEKYKPVIINMVFQMGINGTLCFKNTLKYMQEDKPENVIKNMKASKWYKQTPNRVNRLIKLINEQTVPEYN